MVSSLLSIATGMKRSSTKFPRLYGYNRVGRAKPGGVVLGVDVTQTAAWGPRIILAAQEVGRGRTMAFTSDTTRMWGQDFETIWGERIDPNQSLHELNCDSRYYRRFWINAVRWLAAGKSGSSNAPVTLELAQTVARPGEPVAATIRVLSPKGDERRDTQVQVVLTAGPRRTVPVTATFDTATRLYQARVLAPSPGDYTVVATATLGAVQLGADKQLLVCRDTDVEMEKVQARPDVMAQIARFSGGSTLDPQDQSSTAPPLFGEQPPRDGRIETPFALGQVVVASDRHGHPHNRMGFSPLPGNAVTFTMRKVSRVSWFSTKRIDKPKVFDWSSSIPSFSARRSWILGRTWLAAMFA